MRASSGADETSVASVASVTKTVTKDMGGRVRSSYAGEQNACDAMTFIAYAAVRGASLINARGQLCVEMRCMRSERVSSLW
jgi:hypothetical protein